MSVLLSKNFSSHEFRCPCGCGSEEVHPKLIEILQKIRDQVGPLRISSGNRCQEHNSGITGAARRSMHIPRDGIGHAADVKYYGGSRGPDAILRLYVLADQFGATGLGLYHNRIHVDVRRGRRRARWIDSSWSWTRSS